MVVEVLVVSFLMGRSRAVGSLFVLAVCSQQTASPCLCLQVSPCLSLSWSASFFLPLLELVCKSFLASPYLRLQVQELSVLATDRVFVPLTDTDNKLGIPPSNNFLPCALFLVCEYVTL